jgi:hypothetical protein
MKVKNPRSLCKKLWRIFWNFFGFVANFLILKKRELATFFQNGENSPQILKSLRWGGGRWGSLRVRGGELCSHVNVAGIVASEVARWHARWLAGWLLQSSSSPHFMMFTVFVIKSRIGCCRKFSLITPQGDV